MKEYTLKSTILAFKISEIEGYCIKSEEGDEFHINSTWVSQNEPKVGDYIVDGNHMPAAIFEETYHPVESNSDNEIPDIGIRRIVTNFNDSLDIFFVDDVLNPINVGKELIEIPDEKKWYKKFFV